MTGPMPPQHPGFNAPDWAIRKYEQRLRTYREANDAFLKGLLNIVLFGGAMILTVATYALLTFVPDISSFITGTLAKLGLEGMLAYAARLLLAYLIFRIFWLLLKHFSRCE
jgi:hypothetical protein